MIKKTIKEHMHSGEYPKDILAKISRRASASPYEPLCFTLWEGRLADLPEKYQALPCEVSMSLVTCQLFYDVGYQVQKKAPVSDFQKTRRKILGFSL